MPPPSTPSNRANVQEGNQDPPPSYSNSLQGNTVQRFRNASSSTPDNPPTSLNSLNLISEYMYRNLQREGEEYTDEHESNFRSRILQHFSDIHRLQNHFNILINSREESQRANEEVALSAIPNQLRNLARDGSFGSEDEDMDYEPVAHSGIDDDSLASEDELPNERLLLASARQNTNIENELSPNQNAIPLRRQNAIRRIDNDKDDVINNEAQNLHHEISSMLKSSKKISPLFGNCFQKKSLRLLFNTFNSLEDSLNLDVKLDTYLKKRGTNTLWNQDFTRIPPPPKTIKRKLVDSELRSRKRQKVSQERTDTNIRFLRSFSLEENNCILDGLPNSYFQSGSNFILNINKNPLNQCEMILNKVDEAFNGFLKFSSEPTLEAMLLKLHNFTKYFCGFDENSYNLPRNKILIRKLNVLDRISVDNKIKFSPLVERQLILPFHGHRVDFKNHDLRFLLDNQSTSSRFRSNKIRLQLLEWMKIQPFKQFKESFFINFTSNLDYHLTSFNESRVKKSQKTETISLAKEFKLNLNRLIKDFSHSKCDTINSKNTTKRYTDLFIEDWERNLAKKLCEEITTEESRTLLNVQLNYVLFTIDLNISSFLDLYIKYIFDHCKGDYVNNYRRVYNNILNDEVKDSTCNASLVCSIDRKLGTIEVENTLPHIHFKDSKQSNVILSRNQNMMEFYGRNTYVYDDFDLFEGERPLNSKTFNTHCKSEIIETTLTGKIQMINPEYDTL